MTYHAHVRRVAAVLQADRADVARGIRDTLTDLDRADIMFLKDVERGRYQWIADARLILLATESADIAIRDGVPESVSAVIAREFARRGEPVLAADEVIDDETRTNGEFDVCENAFGRMLAMGRKDRSVIRRTIEWGQRQIDQTRRVIRRAELELPT